MPAYPQTAAFLQRVAAVNPNYSRFKNSSLTPLIALLNQANTTSHQVATVIHQIKSQPDGAFVNKANKYKDALHFLQRTFPVPQHQWVRLGASRSRAARYPQTAVPNPFNAYGPNMYHNVQRLNPGGQWVGATAQTIEDYIYTAPGAVGVVMIHIDAHQNGMDEVVDGMTVLNHMKSVLRAVAHRGGNACALHIGNTQPVLGALQTEYNALPNRVAVNEQGHRHMGGYHQAFRNFVTQYNTVVVMGFDADVCVRANLFGATEYPDNPVAGTSAITPITGQAEVITSRAVLVTVGTIQAAEYGPINGL